jgi:RNA polymerase sigma-70 factor (ECF subfamily)
MPEPSNRGDAAISAEMFNHTRWSLVAAVRDGAHGSGRDPLEELSAGYWFPVYACIRQHGHAPAQAFGLASRFFAWLARQIREDAPAGFGRFRVFLFDRLQCFLAEAVVDDGGGAPAADVEALEQRLAREFAGAVRPDSAFERSFGLQVMARSRERLAEEARRNGRADMFQRLAPFLTSEPAPATLQLLAAELGIGTLAVQVAVKRLRQRFRELVEAELAETVTNSAELEGERAALLAALSGSS